MASSNSGVLHTPHIIMFMYVLQRLYAYVQRLYEHYAYVQRLYEHTYVHYRRLYEHTYVHYRRSFDTSLPLMFTF